MVDVNRIREMAADWLGLAGDAALGYVSRAFQWGYFRSTGSPWSACHRAMGLAPSLRWVFTGRDERRVGPDISDAFAQGVRQAEEAWSERLRAEQGRATPPVASAAATVPESHTEAHAQDGSSDDQAAEDERVRSLENGAHAEGVIEGLRWAESIIVAVANDHDRWGRLVDAMQAAIARASNGVDRATRGPTLDALRELVAKWNAHAGPSVMPAPSAAQGPTLEALRELAVSFRANEAKAARYNDPFHDGRRIAFGFCVKALCRVAGIEPPLAPMGPTGAAARTSIDAHDRVTWWGYGRRWYGTATGAVTGDGYAVVDPDDRADWGSRLVTLSHVRRVEDATPIDESDSIADPRGTPGPGAQGGAAVDQAADCPGCDGALVKPTHNAEGAALGVDCSKAGVDSAAAEAHVHDVLGALNETLVAEWRRLAADHRSAAALNQPDAPSPLPSAPSTAPAAVTAPQGPRIEVRDGAEVTVDSYDTNGCQEEGPVHGGVCTVHIDGMHVCEDGPAAAPDRGLWHVLERWPIAPALPETPDPRWEPGAVWEHNGGRHRIGSALPSERPTHARFIGLLADVEFVSMTEANGWRFVPAKPSQVKQWQVWRCVGIDGELEVHYLRREDDPRDVGLRRLGTSGVSVRARATDMLGLKEWTFVRGPR